jgi:mannitol/fructose-specific phosphotransferase system IIA component (Ntr-type)
MVGSLAAAGALKPGDVDQVVTLILKREQLNSTGIGNGVAVPHTKFLSLPKISGTIAVSKTGLDFQSIDREPVDVIFLLVSPTERPGDHLRALESISRHLRSEEFRQKLREAESPQAIKAILEQADQNRFE